MKHVFIPPDLWVSEIIKAAKEKTLNPEDVEFHVNSLVRCGNKNEIGVILKLILNELLI